MAGFILYILDYRVEIEKIDNDCPLYSHRVYRDDCTIKKFINLDEDKEPDTACQEIFTKNEEAFVCKWQVCLNIKDSDFWDPDGFCVKECSEDHTLNEDENLCDPQCETDMKWDPLKQKCSYYMN